MTTQNGLNLILSGSTGTGNFVGANTPTLITPNLGVANATSLAFSPSTNGIIGTTTNNNAASGNVGEFFESIISGASSISLTTATPANITSFSLPAGDWDIHGTISITSSGNLLTIAAGWTSLSSATVPDISLYNFLTDSTPFTHWGSNAPYLRVSIATSTTVYLSCSATFGSGTVTACGGIFARRVR
jgi:hypothetical protein